MDSKTIIKLLEQDGWTLRGVKGSHHVYIHPLRGGHISVPHLRTTWVRGLFINYSSKQG
jgi:predicted RNA binding protein YcfA (HicA-like mRNA interferase family)